MSVMSVQSLGRSLLLGCALATLGCAARSHQIGLAAVAAAAAQDSTNGQLGRLTEADHHWSIAERLDPAQFTPLVESARAFRFGELYNLAVERSGRGEMSRARRLLELARTTSDAPSHRNRTRVLDLQIALSETLQLDAPDRSPRTMKILYELESLKDDGADDDALLDEIENTLARARSLLTNP